MPRSAFKSQYSPNHYYQTIVMQIKFIFGKKIEKLFSYHESVVRNPLALCTDECSNDLVFRKFSRNRTLSSRFALFPFWELSFGSYLHYRTCIEFQSLFEREKLSQISTYMMVMMMACVMA